MILPQVHLRFGSIVNLDCSDWVYPFLAAPRLKTVCGVRLIWDAQLPDPFSFGRR